ncbi:hypothetical protein M434DRAFT_28069 [Hypoxylon sp. CO27-5]|nr:hypothetical protein M434DRAFT_28069 [Hypoxylon sp. CO27-5]
MSPSKNQVCAASGDEKPHVAGASPSTTKETADVKNASPCAKVLVSASASAVASPASPTSTISNVEPTTPTGAEKTGAEKVGAEKVATSPAGTPTAAPAQQLSPIKERSSEPTSPNSSPSEKIFSIISFHVDSDIVVPVKTSKGKVMFKVSSGNMVSASAIWAEHLYRNNAGRSDTDEWMVEIDGNVDALTTIFNIVHFKFSDIPETLTLDELYEISLVLSQYECVHLIYPWASKWVESLTSLVADASLHHVCHKALLVAWVFGHVQLFRDMTHALVISSRLINGELANVDGTLLKEMVLPPGIFDLIFDARSKAMAIIVSAIEKPFKQHLTNSGIPKKPLCSLSEPAPECDAMMLGSVIPQLIAAGLFPVLNASTFPRSIYAIKNKLASFKLLTYKVPDAKPHMYGAHAQCNLGYENAVMQCLKGLLLPLQDHHMEQLAKQAKKTGIKNGKEIDQHFHRSTPPRRRHYSPGATIDFTQRPGTSSS